MPTLGQQLVAHLRPLIQGALDEVRREVADDVRQSISDPFPPASDPGTPPHRRTGNLAEGVDSDVTEDPSARRVEMAVWSERVGGDPRVPIFLEQGTEDMEPRPYMRPAYHRGRRRVLSRLAQRTGGVAQ